jgi:hypothetical protein
MKSPTFSSSDLNDLQHHLDSWRQLQSGRSRLPDPLWDAAAHLAGSKGVSLVARTLRIDFYKLQQRVRATSVAQGRLPTTPATPFVELKLDATVARSGTGGVVELFDGPQRRLRLETGHDPALWLALAESFWRSKP